MTPATYFVLFAATMVGAIIIATVMAQRFRGTLPLLALLILGYGFGVMGALGLHGTPKSVETEKNNVPEAQVLWSAAKKGDRIYLLLIWDGLKEPRYYWMPWTEGLDKNLSQARQSATARRSALMVRNPFQGGLMGKGGEQPGGEGRQGNGQGRPGRGQGHEGGAGQETGDNEGAEKMFYPAPPEALPEKPTDAASGGSLRE